MAWVTLATATLLSPMVSPDAAGPNASAQNRALRLFDRLAGVPLSLQDARLQQMSDLIEKGDLQSAAEIAMRDDGFINITTKHLFAPMANREEDPLGSANNVSLNDFVATGMGIVRDDIDAREMLTGNYIYKARAADSTQLTDDAIYRTNNHYKDLEARNINLARALEQAPQKAYPMTNAMAATAATALADSAGLLTTRQWAQAHLDAGTNRRAVQFAFSQFLCLPISQWADASLPDDRVRRDVDRQPGGNTQTFVNNCRSCHSGMDALAGAFAYMNYATNDGGSYLVHQPGTVQGKYAINRNVYPEGYVTANNSWANRSTRNHNSEIGWQGALDGSGVNALGQMLSNTHQFSRCMAKRAYTEVCRRAPIDSEFKILEELANDFENSGYKLRRLFGKAASHPNCVGSGAQ